LEWNCLGIRIANKREQLDLEQWVLFGADTHEYAGVISMFSWPTREFLDT